MPSCSPRTPWPIVAAVGQLDRHDAPIAEVWRRACELAETIGVIRPSYEQIRRLVHRARELRSLPGSVGVVVEAAFQVRSPVSAVDELIERSLARRAARAAIEDERRWRPPP